MTAPLAVIAVVVIVAAAADRKGGLSAWPITLLFLGLVLDALRR